MDDFKIKSVFKNFLSVSSMMATTGARARNRSIGLLWLIRVVISWQNIFPYIQQGCSRDQKLERELRLGGTSEKNCGRKLLAQFSSVPSEVGQVICQMVFITVISESVMGTKEKNAR